MHYILCTYVLHPRRSHRLYYRYHIISRTKIKLNNHDWYVHNNNINTALFSDIEKLPIVALLCVDTAIQLLNV